MKPLSSNITTVDKFISGKSRVIYLPYIIDAVQCFKQRKWIYNEGDDGLCHDCALEQDFGKELTHTPVGKSELLGSPNRDSSGLCNPTGSLSCEYRDECKQKCGMVADYFCPDCGGYYCKLHNRKKHHCSKEERK